MPALAGNRKGIRLVLVLVLEFPFVFRGRKENHTFSVNPKFGLKLGRHLPIVGAKKPLPATVKSVKL